ncbi:MAG TPA: hypothetical protein PKN86_12685 [Candidatus Obscuribacter sp.]|nr:hypothetical protein [Candidatus Obscuribacter sp.]HMX45705.1 hypothetical protein [Candidatus Obscuribacter sp.]HMY04570.1 hypothetical protein [Candidatus Obscuribacter sp.]HMY55681.1 hypothetical protein [Candidatus Obscuribacter sp.]HNB15406.1 hypothetical protein [Candidatus Obscuribacter sp.]
MKPNIGIQASVSVQRGLTLVDVMLAAAVLLILGMPAGAVVLLVMLAMTLLVICAVAAVLAMRLLVTGLRWLLQESKDRQR